VLAFPLIGRYNGARGRCTRGERWLFYLFYPAHLLALGWVTNRLLR
jgi:hypothetical protein